MLTSERITKRAVLYVGLVCDLHCRFCYYAHKDAEQRTFRTLDWLKDRVSMFHNQYGNTAVDITGGEPTIYPLITELVEYCAGNLGMWTCIISHGQHIKKRFSDLRKAGLSEFLLSLHGLRSTHDALVDREGAFDTLVGNFAFLRDRGFQFRTNTVVTKQNVGELVGIANLLSRSGATTSNFIIFNPFYDWGADGAIDFQARHSDITGPLVDAIGILEVAGVKANVRYLPFCQLPGAEANVVDFMQLPYDKDEWDFRSWHLHNEDDDFNRAAFAKAVLPGCRDDEAIYVGRALLDRSYLYVKSDECAFCAANVVCDGLSKQYAERFGFSEIRPYLGRTIMDPLYFKGTAKRKSPREGRCPNCRGMLVLGG